MQIAQNIYSVGIIDREVEFFHAYRSPVGTTYNAYLVIDGDHRILIDCVKARFADSFLENIREVIGEEPLTDIICNHVEPDHSGSLPAVLAAYPEVAVYGTAACKRELDIYYPGMDYKFETVIAGDLLETENCTFTFIPMPMVHWPDSMSTYLAEHKMLFSNDAFGQHIGTGELRDSELSREYFLQRASEYYGTIVLPFGAQVVKLLDAAKELDIETVCPSHGVIIETYLDDIVAKYRSWATGELDDFEATIIFDTMWGTTAKMAERIKDEYESKGLSVRMFNLSEEHYSTAMANILESKYIAVGSPTLNNQMLPNVAAFLVYAKGLKPKNRIGRAFGSYGWSGESVKYIQAELESMGFEIEEAYKAQWNI